MTMDWKTAQLKDFHEIDSRLYSQLPPAYREGTHLAVLSAILHTPTLRPKDYQYRDVMNEVATFRFIRDHGDLPLSTQTILEMYGTMLTDGTEAGWKTGNVYLENKEGFYIPSAADTTPDAMEELCRQYEFLNNPQPEQFDEIFKFILAFICIHPFQDGNGRMSSFLMQFLLQKAGLKCAVYLPLDLIQNGVFMKLTSRRIRSASGAFWGMKLEYDRYIPYMKDLLAKSYQVMLDAAVKMNQQ